MEGARANDHVRHAACYLTNFRMKLQTLNRHAARGAPATVVAHLDVSQMNADFMTEDEMLAHMGTTLLNVQQFELLLSGALKQIYADVADLTPEKLYAEDKRTLGVLVRTLQERAAVDSDIDSLLAAVLRDRNLFVHRLRHQPWFDTSTESGRLRVWEFLAPFSLNLNRATKLLVALHVKHSDEIGFDSPVLREIKRDPLWQISDYYPHSGRIRKRG